MLPQDARIFFHQQCLHRSMSLKRDRRANAALEGDPRWRVAPGDTIGPSQHARRANPAYFPAVQVKGGNPRVDACREV